MKTYHAREEDIKREWYWADAKDQVLGRFATQIATILRGKNKPIFTPHVDCGDFVIVLNANKVRLTGKKASIKTYYHSTGYPGGLKIESFEKRLKRRPEQIILDAVQGMLPHNRLGRQMLKKLKVYSSERHPHSSQQPKELSIK